MASFDWATTYGHGDAFDVSRALCLPPHRPTQNSFHQLALKSNGTNHVRIYRYLGKPSTAWESNSELRRMWVDLAWVNVCP